MRVPLIIAGGPLKWVHHTVNEDCFSSSIDIVPTILSLCINVNKSHERKRIRVFIIYN